MLKISASNVRLIIVELAERSPIIIQSSSNPSSQKNLDLRPYDRSYKMLLLTCVVICTPGTPNATALCSKQSSSQCTELRVGRLGFQSCPGQGVVPLRRAGKKCELRFQAWLNLYIAKFIEGKLVGNTHAFCEYGCGILQELSHFVRRNAEICGKIELRML